MAANRTRGQRAGLTRQAVLDAALRLADREGLAALSMRRLGAELGVEAMTLYHHVAGKEALLDGLVEAVVVRSTPPPAEDGSWREMLRAYARSLSATLRAHPNVLPLVMSRPALTPHNLRAMETALRSLAGAGFDLRTSLDIVYALTEFVAGHVITQAGTQRKAADRQGAPPDIDADEHPLLAEAIEAARPGGPDARFDLTLEALLTGFDAVSPRTEGST